MIRFTMPVMLVALVGLSLTATQAFARGPLNDKNILTPYYGPWIKVVPGKNPLTVDEAAATMAYFLTQNENCGGKNGKLGLESLNLNAFEHDVVAGGGNPAEFNPDGQHFQAVLAYVEQFRKNTKPSEWRLSFCPLNPYRKK